MDFGTLDSMIQQEDLADADKKKILQSKRWKEHSKEHFGAELVSVEKEEILAPEKNSEKGTTEKGTETTPPPVNSPTVDAWWLRDEEKKALEPPRSQQIQSTHEAQHVAWECSCGKAMESPKEKEGGAGYKLQKEDEDSGADNAYKTGKSGNEMYGRTEPSESAGGAYLGGGNMQDRQDQMYGRPS
ncbi:MAG: hypothetical protein AABX70_07685 [Nanoarchaeota archaeon]